jgi:signal transduction histidine kinase
MVSHDLRSPLSVITGLNGLLQVGALGRLNASGLVQVQISERSAERMLVIINDLLDAEKLRTGMLLLDKEELSLGDVLEESIQATADLALAKQVSIVAPATPIEVLADSHRLQQIIAKLLENAITSSPPNSNVIVWADESVGYVRLFVKDEGPGLPKELQNKVFERYGLMVGTGESTVGGGSSLGLYICRTLVELHGGSIKVETDGDRGNTFSFSIPKAGSERVISSRREVG